MLKNFIYIIKKFKTSSILNILGLSVAFAVFIIIVIQSYFDFSFDRNFKKSDNIYLYSHYSTDFFVDQRTSSISVPLAKRISENFPEVKNYCLIRKDFWNSTFDILDNNGNKIIFNSLLIKASTGFLDLFEPEILNGDPLAALTETQKVIIPESIAKLFLGEQNPIGEHIFLHNSITPLTISAVYKDFPENCSMKNGIYTYLPDDREGLYNYEGYFEVDKNNLSSLLSKLNDTSFLGKDFSKIELTQLTKVHFFLPGTGEGNITTTISLLAIGIITLIIAFINFLNFSISLVPTRIRTIHIQKILGADSFIQKQSIKLEGVFFTIIAFMLSLLYESLVKNTFIKDFFSADLSIIKNIFLISIIGIILLIIGYLFGIYPAEYIKQINPSDVLKGSFQHSLKSIRLRNFLIIIQFSCSIILIIVSIFIKLQHNYMTNYSWGIQKENILYIPYSPIGENSKNFGNELTKNSEIIDYTATSFLPGSVVQSWGLDFKDKLVEAFIWPVESNFLNFFGIDIIEGRNFNESDDHQNREKIILNKKFLEEYGFTSEIVGLPFGEEDDKIDIIGIMENINFESLKSNIKPMGFILSPEEFKWNQWFLIKTSGNNTQEVIEFIEKTWKDFTPENFEIYFLDSALEYLYYKENNLAKLISYSGFIAILIAVMGSFGLIVFNSRSKEKEIAIRKVNGASIKEIILILNRKLLIQFGISFIIAVPVSYFIVEFWLENFAYKIPIYWWVFLIGSLIVFIINIVTVSWQSYKSAVTNPTKSLKKE